VSNSSFNVGNCGGIEVSLSCGVIIVMFHGEHVLLRVYSDSRDTVEDLFDLNDISE